MRYKCPNCGTEYADPNITEKDKFIKCMICNTKINLKDTNNIFDV